MSLVLLHILVMGFVLVLESSPAEWWSNGVSECCTFSESDPPGDAFSAYPMSIPLLQILRTVPTRRRPSAVTPRAVRRVLPFRNRIVTVPEPRPTNPGRAGARPYRYAYPKLRFDPSLWNR
jgi:hypothetical protein